MNSTQNHPLRRLFDIFSILLLTSLASLGAQVVSFDSNETIELESGWIAIAQPSGFSPAEQAQIMQMVNAKLQAAGISPGATHWPRASRTRSSGWSSPRSDRTALPRRSPSSSGLSRCPRSAPRARGFAPGFPPAPGHRPTSGLPMAESLVPPGLAPRQRTTGHIQSVGSSRCHDTRTGREATPWRGRKSYRSPNPKRMYVDPSRPSRWPRPPTARPMTCSPSSVKLVGGARMPVLDVGSSP